MSTTKQDVSEESVWEETPDMVEPDYAIDERPDTWWESILYGWQHTLVDTTPLVVPLVVASAIGMSSAQGAQFVNLCLFTMGIATLLQTTIGNRLPIIQGPSATLTGTLVSVGGTLGGPAMWGGVFIGGLTEMFIGLFGILKYLRKFFPITVSGVVVISIGISLGQTAVGWMIGDGRPINFILAAIAIALIFIFQVFFDGVLSRGSIFFSIWIVGLGLGSLLGEVDWALVASKPMFAFPKLFPFGGPGFGWEFGVAAIFGVFAGYLGSIVESIGDYAATCAVAGEEYKVKHMNRGIFSEGLGSVVASIFGGMPCTSYTQNIGVIATTKIASRFVVKIAAVILMLYGLIPKFGALLVAMPRPVIGGVFVVVCGTISMSGIQLIHAAEDNTINSLIIGSTLVFAIGIPVYTQNTLGEEWLGQLPAFVELLLTNTVVLSVILGITLNAILNVGMAKNQ